MSVLNVGSDQKYSTISSAIAAAKDGDTVLVQAGTYVNDFATITHNITLKSVGGLAVLQATVAPPNGKAILTTDADVTIDGFGFTGAAVSDANGAGIRYELGNLVVRNSVFWDNQEGILGNAVSNGTVTIDSSEFSHNGAGDGYSHNIYIGAIASLVVTNSYFHDSVVGHEIKSRAYNTTISNNRIFDNNGNGSYSIDVPNGGNATITGNIIEKGANAPNYTTIHYGGEGTPYASSSLNISGNTIVNDNANGILLNNQSTVAATLTNNSIWGFASDHLYGGTTASTATASGTITLASRPVLDLSSKAPTVLPPLADAASTTTDVPDGLAYTNFGIAGAVTASGHILTVGAKGAQFQTLAAALAASQDGDTIQVAAGTYVNDFGSVTHKVIIEGVGGIAHFVQKNAPNSPAGILTVSADATLRNLEFSGGTGGMNKHEGGITVFGGNVTIVNTSLHDNDTGINVADGAAISVSIYGSDISSNGNTDKGTHNLTIGSIGSFTMRDSYVHNALTGHEISDHAMFTDFENNRVIDGSTATASYLLGLTLGGQATIKNNVFEKGLHPDNDILVMIGGEGRPYSNTNVTMDGNTFVSDMVWPDHPYTFFVDATSDVASAGPITATNNTFVGGISGSQQFINVKATGSKVASSAPLDLSSPVSAALAPTATATARGMNTLTLSMSAARGPMDTQFIVSVDNIVVGGGVVTAQSTDGATQTFSFGGSWAAGSHQVTVNGYNLYSYWTPEADFAGTSLTVSSISMDGMVVRPATKLDQSTTSLTASLSSKSLPDFDAAYYYAHNPDVAAAGVDALAHYLRYGANEGRNPNALFDTRYYLSHNPDVAASGINPLVHFDSGGWAEGRDPSVLFSVNTYFAAHPDVLAANVNPLQVYLTSGDTKSYADPLLDPTFYHKLKPAIAATVQDASADYHSVGWKQGFDASAWFDTNYYLTNNPDVKAAGIDPLQHYETYGWKEGRAANPWFSTSAYTQAHPETVGTGIDPMLSFIESTGSSTPWTSPYLTKEAAAFDPAYYLAHNPDVAAAHLDPLVHYEQYGWHEDRNPSAAFSSTKYLAAYADVKAAGMDPLAHYTTYGANEGRSAFAV